MIVGGLNDPTTSKTTLVKGMLNNVFLNEPRPKRHDYRAILDTRL